MDSRDFFDMPIDMRDRLDTSSVAPEQLQAVDEALDRYYIKAFLNRQR